MAAPTYTWEFAYDLFGTRVPIITTLECATTIYTKVGTLLIMSGGQVTPCAGSDKTIIGLAAEIVSNATATDPIKVALLAPGMVIKGTADADASAYSGFANKLMDMNADGSLDTADQTNGSLSIHRTEDAGLTVYATLAFGALWGQA